MDGASASTHPRPLGEYAHQYVFPAPPPVPPLSVVLNVAVWPTSIGNRLGIGIETVGSVYTVNDVDVQTVYTARSVTVKVTV
jgi:hypothetical protein